MLYEVSYQTKQDAQDSHSHFRHSFYVECEPKPSPNSKKIRELVEKRSSGDFAPETILVDEECDLDPEKLRKNSLVYKLK